MSVFEVAGDVNWNIFRYGADFLHLGGMLVALYVVFRSKSVKGFSRKTQILFLLVYLTRYFNMFLIFLHQPPYLIFFKVTFIAVTVGMLAAFSFFQLTYDETIDSCNIVAFLVPVLVLAVVSSFTNGFVEMLWTFSEMLEPFALVPQYIVCYRAVEVNLIARIYVVAIGNYRVLYAVNWIYRWNMLDGHYHDYTSWISGSAECILFFDFLFCLAYKGKSIHATVLGRLLLLVDENVGKVSHNVEMKLLGRRLPYGLSGAAARVGPESLYCTLDDGSVESP